MKRREVLWSLFGAAGAASAEAARPSPVSPDAIEGLMRARGLEPEPGEAAAVYGFLLSVQRRRLPDPRIEPAIRLDPEAEAKP